MSQDDLSLPPMSDALQRLLEEERAAPARLPAKARARVAEHLALTLGIPLLPGGGGAAGGGAGPAAGGSTGAVAVAAGGAKAGSALAVLLKPLVLAAVAAGAAIGAGTHALVVAPTPVAPAPIAPTAAAPEAIVPAAAAAVPAGPAAVPAPVEAAAPAPARAPQRPDPAAATSAARDDAARDRELAAERASLEQARTALVRGKADEAIVTLQGHLSTYRRGELREEAEALLTMSFAAAGRVDEARAAAARFHEAHPDALLGPAVDRAVRDATQR